MKELEKRNHIIEQAKSVFENMGIGPATMHLIADAAGLSRRTLYRYYESKEDLALHVLLSYMDIWNQAQDDMYKNIKGSGIEKLEGLLYAMMDYMTDHMNMIKFMAYFDFYFRDAQEIHIDDELNTILNQSFHRSDQIFYDIIEDGIVDGSITLKEEIKLFVTTLTSVLWIYGQGIALREKQLSKENGFDPMDMYKCQIRIYLDSIRS